MVAKLKAVDIDWERSTIRPGQLARLLGVSPRVVSDLITGTIGEASIRGAEGRGTKRILSVQDGFLVYLGKRFRDIGLPPVRVRHLCDAVRDSWSLIYPPVVHLEERDSDDGFDPPGDPDDWIWFLYEDAMFRHITFRFITERDRREFFTPGVAEIICMTNLSTFAWDFAEAAREWLTD